jgi:hypothetical protein
MDAARFICSSGAKGREGTVATSPVRMAISCEIISIVFSERPDFAGRPILRARHFAPASIIR